MVTKGIVVELIEDKAIVRLPIFDGIEGTQNATGKNNLSKATVCTLPNATNVLSVDDIVYVAFEDDDISKPVIIGHLKKEGLTKTTPSLKLGELSTSSTTNLSEYTSIGNITPTEIKMLKGVQKNIQLQIDNVRETYLPLLGGVIEGDLEVKGSLTLSQDLDITGELQNLDVVGYANVQGDTTLNTLNMKSTINLPTFKLGDAPAINGTGQTTIGNNRNVQYVFENSHFRPSISTFDKDGKSTLSIGTSNYKWKDLYLEGNISDGVNNLTVAQIASKTYSDNNKTSAINSAKAYTDTSINDTKQYVDTSIANIIDGAPDTLNTLKEVADWISNDETGAAALFNDIADIRNTYLPLSGGTMSGAITLQAGASASDGKGMNFTTGARIGSNSAGELGFYSKGSFYIRPNWNNNSYGLLLTKDRLAPANNNEVDLGSSSLKFKDGYFNTNLIIDNNDTSNRIIFKQNGTSVYDISKGSSGASLYIWDYAKSFSPYTTAGDTVIKTLSAKGGTVQEFIFNANGQFILPASGNIAFKNVDGTNTAKGIWCYGGDSYGNSIAIGAGGSTILGSGESASAITNSSNDGYINPASESTHILSDTYIKLYSNCQTWADRKEATLLNADGDTIFPGTVSANSLSGNAIYNRTGVNALKATSSWTNDSRIPTLNVLAYWDGRYDTAGNSNLNYSKNGVIVGTTSTQTISGQKTFSGVTNFNARIQVNGSHLNIQNTANAYNDTLSSLVKRALYFSDKNNTAYGAIDCNKNTDGSTEIYFNALTYVGTRADGTSYNAAKWATDTTVDANNNYFGLKIASNGTAIAYAPTPSTTLRGKEVATTAYVNNCNYVTLWSGGEGTANAVLTLSDAYTKYQYLIITVRDSEHQRYGSEIIDTSELNSTYEHIIIIDDTYGKVLTFPTTTTCKILRGNYTYVSKIIGMGIR